MEETKDLIFISDQHRNDLFQGPRAKKWHFIWPLDKEDNITQFSQWTIQDLMAFINELPRVSSGGPHPRPVRGC